MREAKVAPLIKGDLVTILDGGWGAYFVPSLPFKTEWPVYAAFHMNELVVPTVIRGCNSS